MNTSESFKPAACNTINEATCADEKAGADTAGPEPDVRMSTQKRAWWAATWPSPRPGIKQPRVAVFQFAMNSTTRHSAPDETIAHGYMRQKKLHDGEPGAVLDAILALDPNFFDSYPSSTAKPKSTKYLRAIIGETALAFYNHGMHNFHVHKHAGGPSAVGQPEPPLAVL